MILKDRKVTVAEVTDIWDSSLRTKYGSSTIIQRANARVWNGNICSHWSK